MSHYKLSEIQKCNYFRYTLWCNWGLYKNYKKIDNVKLVKFALTNIINKNTAREIYAKYHLMQALLKVYNVAEHFKIEFNYCK
jgi:hypothetical protein